MLLHQSEQRKNAALTLVVSTEKQHDVLQRYYNQQAPEDQRQHTQYCRRIGQFTAGSRQGGIQRIQRAGADIAVNDTERTQQSRCGHGLFSACMS